MLLTTMFHWVTMGVIVSTILGLVWLSWETWKELTITEEDYQQ